MLFRSLLPASIRYFAHRIDRAGNRVTRAIFGQYGTLSKQQAYRMIDRIKGQAYFYRIVISPKHEAGERADLTSITRQTMRELQKILRSKRSVPYIAVTHTDHSQTPHVHALAVLRTYLTEEKLTKLREACEVVVLTGQEVRQTIRSPEFQTRDDRQDNARQGRLLRLRTSPDKSRVSGRSMRPTGDIFIAKSSQTSTATLGRGRGGMGPAARPGRKLFICPGCNQASALKKVDSYFECKRCGMEIGRRRSLHIFAQRQEGGDSYPL